MVNTVVSSATNLVNLGVSTYLEEQRYATLLAIVPEMDASVHTAGKIMKDALLAIRKVQLAHMVDELKKDKEPFDTGNMEDLSQAEYRTQASALMSGVATFNLARASDPSATISAMIEAHGQLAEALKNNTGKDQDLVAAAQKFSKAAQQLNTAVNIGSASAAGVTEKTGGAPQNGGN